MTDHPPTEQAFRDAIAANVGGMARLRPSRRAEAAEDLHAAVVKAHREIVDARLAHFIEQDRQYEREMLAARRERDTLQAHVGALEGELERAKGELRELAVERNRDRDQLSEARGGLERLTSEVNELRTELDTERETLETDEVTIRGLTAERDDLAAELGRMRERLAALIADGRVSIDTARAIEGFPALPPAETAAQTPVAGARSAPREET